MTNPFHLRSHFSRCFPPEPFTKPLQRGIFSLGRTSSGNNHDITNALIGTNLLAYLIEVAVPSTVKSFGQVNEHDPFLSLAAREKLTLQLTLHNVSLEVQLLGGSRRILQDVYCSLLTC